MYMKKLIPLLFTALLFTSCEKEPDLDKVQNDYVVYTQYDKNANFSKGNTFYVPDSVLLIGNKSQNATYLDTTTGDFIINAYTTQMQSKGYTKVTDKSEATYGLQLSYIESTYYFVDSPNWWYDYPWYWSPSYWWPWVNGNWYYPYQFIYSYTSGSLLCEMIDLSSVSTTTTNVNPTVIWNNYITNVASFNKANESKLTNAIGQAFKQSPYLQYNN